VVRSANHPPLSGDPPATSATLMPMPPCIVVVIGVHVASASRSPSCCCFSDRRCFRWDVAAAAGASSTSANTPSSSPPPIAVAVVAYIGGSPRAFVGVGRRGGGILCCDQRN
jgi:hypothetical protein